MTSTEIIEIIASPRTIGKSSSRSLRRERHIPSVAYGPKLKNTNFCITQNDATKYSTSKFDNALFSLKSEDSSLNGVRVLMKKVDKHPVSKMPIHIDFYSPDLTKTVKVNVELRFTGKAKGLEDGGLFNALRRDIEVECLPTEIPDFIEVDVTGLELNQTMHVSDLTLPGGLKLITAPELSVANVAMVAEEKEEEVVAAPAEGDDAAAPAADAKPEEKK